MGKVSGERREERGAGEERREKRGADFNGFFLKRNCFFLFLVEYLSLNLGEILQPNVCF
jgi:hypothetical protein